MVSKSASEPSHRHLVDPHIKVKPYEYLVRDLTLEERKILDILVANDGKSPLEYLRRESGLTSIRTHRAVARLAAKGTILVGRSETNNEVQLAAWLHLTTGFNNLDSLTFGGIPEGYAVILCSSFSDERQLLIKRFLEAGVECGQVTFYVTVDPGSVSRLAEKFPTDFYLFVCNQKADVMVKNMPNIFRLRSVENLTDISIALTKAFRLVDNSRLGPRRACIEIVSDVLLEHHSVVARKWLSGLIPELRSNGFTTLAIVNPRMHSPEELEAIVGLFEGEIRITERETEQGIEQYLRVRKLYNQQYVENEIVVSKEELSA